jgi:hypothetical protein
MREQADRVEEAFARRVAETEEATRNLEAELKQVSCFRISDLGKLKLVKFGHGNMVLDSTQFLLIPYA